MIVRFLSFILVAAIAGGALYAQGDERDRIVRKDAVKRDCYIESETTTDVLYKQSKNPNIPAQKMPLREVAHLEYAEMREGPYPKGMDARERGKYEEAADWFNNLATTGAREWQKVYGAFLEGDSLDMAKKYAGAAEAFNKLAGFKNHRLWLDGRYRTGFALALAGKAADATKVAEELSAYAKEKSLNPAEARANAIRAAIASAAEDPAKTIEFAKKANFLPSDEREVWYHFNVFYAESLRKLQRFKEAEGQYRILLTNLDGDPAKKAQISLGLGLCLMQTDKQAGMVELLKLDVMPYGSPDQKCDARYFAGKAMWDDAQTLKANPDAMKDERRAAFVKEQEKTARLLLGAAASSIGTSPLKAAAKELLDTVGPDPEDKAAEDADKAAADKAAADKGGAGGAPLPAAPPAGGAKPPTGAKTPAGGKKAAPAAK